MPAAAPAKAKSHTELQMSARPGVSPERRLADVGVDPAASGMATVLKFSKGTFGDLPMTESYEAVADAVREVRKGNLSGPEATLVAQSVALNSIFTELARRSAANMGEYIEASERYMRLALKAQAQCRATIETLATLKNPPVVFARQANIANGPQQVNNGGLPARADNPAPPPNELLEAGNGERLDGGAASAPIGRDTTLETVGTIDGADDAGRKGASKPKRVQRG
jgi:hypothetical protein